MSLRPATSTPIGIWATVYDGIEKRASLPKWGLFEPKVTMAVVADASPTVSGRDSKQPSSNPAASNHCADKLSSGLASCAGHPYRLHLVDRHSRRGLP